MVVVVWLLLLLWLWVWLWLWPVAGGRWCWLRLFRVCFCVVVFVKIWCSWFVVLVCSRLCVCVDSSSLDTISRGAWPFLIGRVTCLSDLVSVRAVKKMYTQHTHVHTTHTCTHNTTSTHNTTCTHTTPHAHTHNTTCTHNTYKTTHPTHHSTVFIQNCNNCNACIFFCGFVVFDFISNCNVCNLIQAYCFRFYLRLVTVFFSGTMVSVKGKRC